jgi:adenine-specific DNA methylase
MSSPRSKTRNQVYVRCQNFEMKLEWTHKIELKVKLIYTKQERTWLVQIETKMVDEWNHKNMQSYDLSTQPRFEWFFPPYSRHCKCQ